MFKPLKLENPGYNFMMKHFHGTDNVFCTSVYLTVYFFNLTLYSCIFYNSL